MKKRLLEQTQKIKKLQNTINFIRQKSQIPELKSHTDEFISLIQQHAISFSLLYQYDENKITAHRTKKSKFILNYDECKDLVEKLKQKLIEKNEASNLFGQEVNNNFSSVIPKSSKKGGKNKVVYCRSLIYQSRFFEPCPFFYKTLNSIETKNF